MSKRSIRNAAKKKQSRQHRDRSTAWLCLCRLPLFGRQQARHPVVLVDAWLLRPCSLSSPPVICVCVVCGTNLVEK